MNRLCILIYIPLDIFYYTFFILLYDNNLIKRILHFKCSAYRVSDDERNNCLQPVKSKILHKHRT